jgi:hypothetical protein
LEAVSAPPVPAPLERVVTAEPVELPELVPAVFAELVAAAEVVTLRERAGSCPVIRTTASAAHTTMNSATEYPITRPRICRTRACLCCLILIASAELMDMRIGPPRSSRVWAA